MTAALDYPVSLAVEDFVPVVCTTVGVLFLRRVTGTPGTIAAAALIGAGGFAKATAKLVVALDGPDLIWLRSALFPLLTLGFALLYLELTRNPGISRTRAAITAAVIGACAATALLVADVLPMLVSTTIFATLTAVRLINLARARGDTLAAVLFGAQIAVFFVLGPLGARADQTVTLQWIEQLTNTAGQAAFLLGAIRLSRALR
ncbi:hypothetical protein [Nocardia sp. NPDC057353]|uniref:hypothetical protein n=1 Tax=Nocardia sp. NPDC057353 TaxID=3346104 RepID=UPI003631DE70